MIPQSRQIPHETFKFDSSAILLQGVCRRFFSKFPVWLVPRAACERWDGKFEDARRPHMTQIEFRIPPSKWRHAIWAFLSREFPHFLLFRSAIEPKLVFGTLGEPSPLQTHQKRLLEMWKKALAKKKRNRWEKFNFMNDFPHAWRHQNVPKTFLWDAVRKLTFGKFLRNFLTTKKFSTSHSAFRSHYD